MSYGNWGYDAKPQKEEALSRIFNVDDDEPHGDKIYMGHTMGEILMMLFDLQELPYKGNVEKLIKNCFGAVIEKEMDDSIEVEAISEKPPFTPEYPLAEYAIYIPKGLSPRERNWKIAFGYGLLLFYGDEALSRKFADTLLEGDNMIISEEGHYILRKQSSEN